MTDSFLEELDDLVFGYATSQEKAQSPVAAKTGLVSLDINLGGGLPSGLVEIFGEESVGKTCLAGQIAGYNQRAHRVVAWHPSEQIDHQYLSRLGTCLDQLPLLPVGEFTSFFREFDEAVLIIDSLSALRPAVDDWNDFVFNFLRWLQELIRPGQCVICTGHVRSKLSADRRKTFVGGVESANRRITDLFSTRLHLTRKDVTETTYTQVVNILANTLAPPSRYLELPSRKGYGADRWLDLIRTGVSVGVVEGGSHFHYQGEHLGHGIQATADALRRRPDLASAILRDIEQAGA